MIWNIVEIQLVCELPTKYNILLKISLNTQPLKEINPKWDFSSRTSTSMNFSCLIDSDIQLIMLITLLFTGNYPYKRAVMV